MSRKSTAKLSGPGRASVKERQASIVSSGGGLLVYSLLGQESTVSGVSVRFARLSCLYTEGQFLPEDFQSIPVAHALRKGSSPHTYTDGDGGSEHKLL